MTHAFLPVFVTLLLFPSLAAAQAAHSGSTQEVPFTAVYQELWDSSQTGTWRASISQEALMLPVEESLQRKSGFLGVLYSVLLPGMGELYAGRFDRGKYNLIADGVLWLGLIGVNSYGNWVQEDARTYAVQYAGVNRDGKDDQYFVNIGKYRDIHEYNDQRLVEHRFDEVYYDEQLYFWQWDSKTKQTHYADQRILADEMHNAVTFFALGLAANRIWSAIQTVVFVKDYNNSLEGTQSYLPDMNAQVTSFAGRADGLRLNFSKRF